LERIIAAPSLMQDHAAPKTPDDLQRLPWLGILQPHFFARDRLDLLCNGRTTKLKLAPVMLLDTVTALREAAIEGAGFTNLPEWMAGRDIAAGRLVQLLPKWQLEPLDLQIAHTAHEHLPLRVTSLLEYLEAEIPREILRLDLSAR
jgi:DNA-binding transcriptional LysR family regulator